MSHECMHQAAGGMGSGPPGAAAAGALCALPPMKVPEQPQYYETRAAAQRTLGRVHAGITLPAPVADALAAASSSAYGGTRLTLPHPMPVHVLVHLPGAPLEVTPRRLELKVYHSCGAVRLSTSFGKGEGWAGRVVGGWSVLPRPPGAAADDQPPCLVIHLKHTYAAPAPAATTPEVLLVGQPKLSSGCHVQRRLQSGSAPAHAPAAAQSPASAAAQPAHARAGGAAAAVGQKRKAPAADSGCGGSADMSAEDASNMGDDDDEGADPTFVPRGVKAKVAVPPRNPSSRVPVAPAPLPLQQQPVQQQPPPPQPLPLPLPPQQQQPPPPQPLPQPPQQQQQQQQPPLPINMQQVPPEVGLGGPEAKSDPSAAAAAAAAAGGVAEGGAAAAPAAQVGAAAGNAAGGAAGVAAAAANPAAPAAARADNLAAAAQQAAGVPAAGLHFSHALIASFNRMIDVMETALHAGLQRHP